MPTLHSQGRLQNPLENASQAEERPDYPPASRQGKMAHGSCCGLHSCVCNTVVCIAQLCVEHRQRWQASLCKKNLLRCAVI